MKTLYKVRSCDWHVSVFSDSSNEAFRRGLSLAIHKGYDIGTCVSCEVSGMENTEIFKLSSLVKKSINGKI